MSPFILAAKRWSIRAALAAVALSLNGCDEDVPQHRTGSWRTQPDYLLTYGFIPPGGSAADGVLNSCSLQTMSQTLQCSGRGVCTLWKPDERDNPISFCVCDTKWADPECRTPRKSQTVAYFLSLLGGCLGLDQFYLEDYVLGTLKLLSFGGLGVWWCLDIMRIGSAPVQAYRFRTAHDFPHFAFVLTTVAYAMIVGGIVVYFSTIYFRAKRRKQAMQMQADEEGQPTGDLYKNVFESAVKRGPVPERHRDSRIPGPVGGPVDFFHHKDPPTYQDKLRMQGYGSVGPSAQQVTL